MRRIYCLVLEDGPEERKEIKKERKRAQLGTRVRARVFDAGLLARSHLHPEGPATGQLDQGYPWVSFVPPNSAACFSCSPLNGNNKFRLNVHFLMLN
jgi:hypothetical protein